MRCNYCGSEMSKSKWFLISMILFGKQYRKCSKCGMTSSYILIHHTVHDTTDAKEKELNKKLKDNLKVVWKNG